MPYRADILQGQNSTPKFFPQLFSNLYHIVLSTLCFSLFSIGFSVFLTVLSICFYTKNGVLSKIFRLDDGMIIVVFPDHKPS